VTVGLCLPMTEQEFAVNREMFREAISRAAHMSAIDVLSIADVTIDKTEVVGNEICIALDVRAPDQATDDGIEAALTQENVNAQLRNVNLPAATEFEKHETRMDHRIDCETGVLTDDCYKHRYQPPDPFADVGRKEYEKSMPKDVTVPVGSGGGDADIDLPPEEEGEEAPPPSQGKLPPAERESETAPRPTDDIGDSPSENGDSTGVETERGQHQFEQPLATPEAIKGTPPEPRKGIPPEARQSSGPRARSQEG